MRLEELSGAALAFVVVGLVIAFGAMITSDVISYIGDDYTDNGNSTEWGVANDTLTDTLDSLASFGGWLPLLALVIIAVVIIGFLMGGFGGVRT